MHSHPYQITIRQLFETIVWLSLSLASTIVLFKLAHQGHIPVHTGSDNLDTALMALAMWFLLTGIGAPLGAVVGIYKRKRVVWATYGGFLIMIPPLTYLLFLTLF